MCMIVGPWSPYGLGDLREARIAVIDACVSRKKTRAEAIVTITIDHISSINFLAAAARAPLAPRKS